MSLMYKIKQQCRHVVILKPFYIPWNTHLSIHCCLYIPVCMGHNKKPTTAVPLASVCAFTDPSILYVRFYFFFSCADLNNELELRRKAFTKFTFYLTHSLNRHWILTIYSCLSSCTEIYLKMLKHIVVGCVTFFCLTANWWITSLFESF